MNPRHVAALALVGWYLIAPNIAYFPPGSKNVADKPVQEGWYVSDGGLSDWGVVDVYDTAKECEASLKSVLNNGLTLRNEQTDDPKGKAWAESEAAKQAQCIATDDPRLKGN